jgi:hypothetical protein
MRRRRCVVSSLTSIAEVVYAPSENAHVFAVTVDTTRDQHFYGFGRVASPMGELFCVQLGLKRGTSVIPATDIPTGRFHAIQLYLYWSCVGAADSQVLCTSQAPATGFEFSFSFGNSFEGTDPLENDLYGSAHHPG